MFNKENKRSKTIYWELGEEASVNWVSNTRVNISGREINVPNGKYDYRHNKKNTQL